VTGPSLYENGTLSRVQYDDAGGDQDLNDFILEVAVVGRRSWELVAQALDQEEINRRVAEEGLPRLKSLLGKLAG